MKRNPTRVISSIRDPLEIRLCINLTFATSWRLIAVHNLQHEQRYCRCCSSRLIELSRCTYISLYVITKRHESAQFFLSRRNNQSPLFRINWISSANGKPGEPTRDNLVTHNRSSLQFHGSSRNFFDTTIRPDIAVRFEHTARDNFGKFSAKNLARSRSDW